MEEPFDEDDDFSKRWMIVEVGSTYSVVSADLVEDRIPVGSCFGPYSLKGAYRAIEELKVVRLIMDR